jgi:predicted acylesterase/phospholipase RssA/MinD-like ATPase involved in chromosome partitioning or flagellar assembly
MIYTFYSYKGGVGRSMALANVAQCFYQQGLRVLMIDWDLEAPGLESFFYQDAKGVERSEESLNKVRSNLGLIDLLAAYKRDFLYLPSQPREPKVSKASDALPDLPQQTELTDSPSLDEQFMTLLSENLPTLSHYITPISPPAGTDPEVAKNNRPHGEILLLSAGWRAGARFADYVQEVQTFDWRDFYASFRGESFFEWFRRELKNIADVVLIDSRTGVTEMGGVCTRQLADVVVSLCVPNFQNLEGVAAMTASFNHKDLRARRRRDVEVVVVPARLDDRAEKDRKNLFEEKFRDGFGNLSSGVFSNPHATFWSLRIPYIPAYSYLETLVVGMQGRDKDLEESYNRLTAHLALLAPEGGKIKSCCAEELRRFFPDQRPRIFAFSPYGDESGDFTTFRRRLEEAGLSVWPETPSDNTKNESWMQERINQSEHIVLWLTPQAVNIDIAHRQWRYARQKGKSVHLILSNGPHDLKNLPRWMRAASVHNTAGWNYYAEREFGVTKNDFWGLINLLEGPGQAPRIPFMAPERAKNIVERATELNQIKEYLLEPAPAEINVGIWGAPGMGKTVLAKDVCNDDDVQACFNDGILWVSLGHNPDTVGELRGIYFALTGERLTVESESQVVQKLSERMSGKRYLLVIDEVWSAQHLSPFLRVSPLCARLITTRDANIISGLDAKRINLGSLSQEDSMRILTAKLTIQPDTESNLLGLIERIGKHPLGLRLANKQIRNRVEQGDSLDKALDYLNQRLEKFGILAFDQFTPADYDRSIVRSLSLSLDMLSERERELYQHLAQFPAGEPATLEAITELWFPPQPESQSGPRTQKTVGNPEVEASKLLQRFDDLALLGYDRVRGTARIHKAFRSYLLLSATTPTRTDVTNRIETARRILGGQEATLTQMRELAQWLSDHQQFGYARKLLARARLMSEAQSPESLRRRLAQKHAVATYKDPDLPPDQKLDRAFEILQEGDDLSATSDQETLGIAGAIFKRRWEFEGRKQILERSLYYYLRGYQQGIENDIGYTGINAAFVLDMLASLEEEDAKQVCFSSDTAASRRLQAQNIRRELVAYLTKLARGDGEQEDLKDKQEEFKDKQKDLKQQWWFLATIAEAHFGLGNYDEARYWLKLATTLHDVPEWQRESTARQLATLTRLHRISSLTAEQKAKARSVLKEFLGNNEEAVQSAFTGKVGLALSGGGFRAALYHIGVLARLAELDMLRRVEVISCVSGGSIIGAHYYLELRKLLRENADRQIRRSDYIGIVKRIERDFLAGVQRNIRTRIAANLWINLKMIFWPNYSRTQRLGELYEKHIFSRVEDGEGGSHLLYKKYKHRYLNDLKVRPKGETDFDIKTDNWRRKNKVPMLILNATSLNTGHNWQFTATFMGEPPTPIDTDIDGNYRLRRMYYEQAPKRRRKIRLGHAVAASSCVPGLFEPLPLPGLYKDKMVRLVDGGVHDNQGIASLLEQGCAMLLVSDASGQMNAEDEPGNGPFNVLLRSDSISQSRVRQSQYRDLAARRRVGQLQGLMFVHLKKDLSVDPVDWLDCSEPFDSSDDARPASLRGPLTRYGVRKDIQQLLAGIRTDLDSFSDGEAQALMASGYFMTDYEFSKSIKLFDQDANEFPLDRDGWQFLRLEDSIKEPGRTERLKRLLAAAGQLGFKIWRLWLPLLIVTRLALTILMVVTTLLILTYLRHPDWWNLPLLKIGYSSHSYTLTLGLPGAVDASQVGAPGAPYSWVLRLGGLVSTIAMVLLTGVVGNLVSRIVQWRKTLYEFALGTAMSIAGWLIAGAHLVTFDRLYIRWGKLKNIVDRDRGWDWLRKIVERD